MLLLYVDIRRFSYWMFVCLPRCFCNLNEKNQPNKNNTDNKKKIGIGKKNSFLIFAKIVWKMKGMKTESTYQKKLNRYVLDSFTISRWFQSWLNIQIFFPQILCGKFHYLYSLTEWCRFSFIFYYTSNKRQASMGKKLRSQQLFSHKIL